MRYWTLILAALLLAAAGPAGAAEVNVQALADDGWYSDDTRADGTGTQPAGTNLVSPTLTDDPEATASGNPAHDADILAQILFGAPPVAPPTGTHPAAVHLQIGPSGSGKSQLSHRKDDGTGHAPGSVFADPSFAIDYHWMGDGTGSVTASVKLGVKTAEFGSTGSSSRTGENAWDKVLIYEPGNLNGGSSNGSWAAESVSRTSGKWWFFDRTAGAGTIGTPMTLADMAGALGASTTYSGSKTAQDVYNLITAPGAHITSIQFGIGSGNAGGSVYVNELSTSFYRPGDTTTFGQLPVVNVTQGTQYQTISDAVAAANAGDDITVAAGSYNESFEINLDDVDISGAGMGSTIIVVANQPAPNGAGIHVTGNDVDLSGFTVVGEPSTAAPRYGIKHNNTLGGSIAGVEVHSVYRSGVDLLGVDGITVSGCHIHDNNGAGIGSADGKNITFDNLTLANNAWGGIGLFTWGRYSTLGVTGVVFTGTNSFSEIVPFYLEEGNYNDPLNPEPISFSGNIGDGADVTVQASELSHFLTGDSDNANNYTIFFGNLADAQAAASYPANFAHVTTNRYVDGVVGTDLYVMDAVDGTLGQLGGIQAAVDAADPGDKVNVSAGSFEEQVEIAKDIELAGAGMGATTIVAPVSMPLSYTTSAANFPVLHVHDATVVVRNLTVDGAGRGNTNTRFMGISYRQAGGGIYDCEVKDIRNTPLDGSQHGLGIYLFNDDGIGRSMDVQGCQVSGFQKNGITLNALGGTALALDVSGNVVTGAAGLTADNGDPAQNGIQVYGDLITGPVNGNTVSSIAYDNTNAATKWAATSILDFFSGVDITNNVVSAGHLSIYKYDAYGAITGNDLDVEKIGVYAYGIIATDPPAVVPQPWEEAAAASMRTRPAGGPDAASAALLVVDVSGNTVNFTGPDNTDTWGIEADAGYGPDDLQVTANNNQVSGFGVGMGFYQCASSCNTGVFTSITANNNSITGNTVGMESNVGYLTVDGSCNWWGDADGPSAMGNPSTGDSADGDILWYPWEVADGGACTGMPTTIAANPGGEINDCTSCITVPVDLDRMTSEDVRGVSVTIQLSSELMLCSTPSASIVEGAGSGAFFDGFSNTVMQVLDNGAKSYTVDLALLGSPCGSTSTGTLFTVDVTQDPSVVGDATGTVSVTAVTVRDCVNDPLSGIPGADGSLGIDNTAPPAITDLAAAQLKVGNDGDGDTAIDLSWTPPADPDATTIDIWRKGYGAYPEYDDGGGSVPATPADPTTAAGAGWTLAATVPATSSAYSDEPGSRDFWYYVAFVSDGCYDSGVSNQTGGNLSYHLGDVSPGGGDNQVATIDISALGASYGTVDGDTGYDNELDVGPTTDFFVDARPTTDDAIQFEDLMMFAINHGQVSRAAGAPTPAEANGLVLELPKLPAVGEEFVARLAIEADGSAHGLSVPVHWDRQAVEYLGWTDGGFMARQGGMAPVLSPADGVIDAALIGVRPTGIAGRGTLAELRFRVLSDRDPGFAVGGVEGRDARNQPMSFFAETRGGVGSTPPGALVTSLGPNVPNPFNPSTTVHFRVGEAGPIALRIYSASGRLVRTLVEGPVDAGEHSMLWDGTDDSGGTVASGSYVLRLEGAGTVHTRSMVLLK